MCKTFNGIMKFGVEIWKTGELQPSDTEGRDGDSFEPRCLRTAPGADGLNKGAEPMSTLKKRVCVCIVYNRYICIWICIYKYMHICIYVYMKYIYICICLSLSLSLCIHLYMYFSLSIAIFKAKRHIDLFNFVFIYLTISSIDAYSSVYHIDLKNHKNAVNDMP